MTLFNNIKVLISAIALLLLLVNLIGCSPGYDNSAASSSESISDFTQTDYTDSAITLGENEDITYKEKPINDKNSFLELSDDEIVFASREVLIKAFPNDFIDVYPEISRGTTQGNESITLDYYPSDDDIIDLYQVTFAGRISHPVTVYHFQHYDSDEKVDLAITNDFEYNADMADTAKDFVKRICGIDCANATVSEYVYGNKVCVMLVLYENKVFMVSFHYQDNYPVGFRFSTDYSMALRTMELQHARLLC